MVLLAAGRLLLPGAAFWSAIRVLTGDRPRVAARIAAVTAACGFAFSVAWTSRAAGGSDSSCYVLQAEAFAHGRVALSNPAAAILPDAPGRCSRRPVSSRPARIPGRLEVHAPVRVHFYDPAALDRYLAGQRIETEHVR